MGLGSPWTNDINKTAKTPARVEIGVRVFREISRSKIY